MNANTGALYDSKAAALKAGEMERELVEITGTRSQVERVAQAVAYQHAAEKRRSKAKAARRARRANRR